MEAGGEGEISGFRLLRFSRPGGGDGIVALNLLGSFDSIGENRRIATARNPEKQSFFPALCNEIFIETFAQVSGITSNDIVLVRVISLGPAENQNTNLLFGDLVGQITNVAVDNVEQKICQQS